MRISPGGALQTSIAPRSEAKPPPLLTRIAATWPENGETPPCLGTPLPAHGDANSGIWSISPEALATKLHDVTSHYARTSGSGRALGIVIRMEVLPMPKKLLALGSLAAVLLTASAAPAVTPAEDTGVMVDALVLDRTGNPVAGLNRGDFEVIVGDQDTSRRPAYENGRGRNRATPLRLRLQPEGSAPGATPAGMQHGLAEFVSSRVSGILTRRSSWTSPRCRGSPAGGGRDPPRLFRRSTTSPRWVSGVRSGPPRMHGRRGLHAPCSGRSGSPRSAGAENRRDPVLGQASAPSPGTPGGDLEPVAPWGWADLPSSKAGADDALAALTYGFNAANASVYAVHLEGARRQDEGILEASRAEFVGTAYDLNGSVVGLRRARDSSASLSGRRKQAFARPTDDFLSSLASETGGAYTAQATDFARILEGIEASNRLWYELSFEPFGTNIPGRYQPHEIRVRNRPGLSRGCTPRARRAVEELPSPHAREPPMSRRLFVAAALALAAAGVAAQARTALEVLVLDRDGEPVFGLTERDFVVTRNGANYAVTGVEEQAAGEAPRRFVFVFNRRGADASQLSRALRGT